MTTREEIETRLLRAVEVTPSEDGLRWLDQRVAQVAASPAAARGRRLSTPRMLLRPMALVAVFLLLAGAVGAAIGLIDRLVEATPGWRTAWDRAEVLSLRQTDAGLTLTIERAYADLNQVVVGISVDGLEAPPGLTDDDGNVDHILSWDIELRGPGGWTNLSVQPHPDIAGRMVEANQSAFIITFSDPPPVAGTWKLTVSSVGYGATTNGMVDGTWQFAFDLPKPMGTALSAAVSDTVGQATVTLTELRITPTMITFTSSLDVAGTRVVFWSPGRVTSIRHGDTSYEIADVTHIDANPNQNVSRTTAGTDETAGTWEIEIADLWYSSGDGGPDVHLDGPWTLTVSVP
jgi:hypothetical protein